jgi:hypothetical protein
LLAFPAASPERLPKTHFALEDLAGFPSTMRVEAPMNTPMESTEFWRNILRDFRARTNKHCPSMMTGPACNG